MNIQAEKLDIIQWLAGIDDSKVIKQFMLLKKSSQGNIHAELSQVDLSNIKRFSLSVELTSLLEHRPTL